MVATTTTAKKVITIIGATGGTGLCLVKQALDGGHKVVALVRNPEKLAASLTTEENANTNLTVCKGDVTQYDDIKAALMTGARTMSTDVIVSLGGRDKICSEAQPVINSALNDVNPDMRMCVVTSMAVGDSYHDVTWGTRRFADWIIPNAIRDKNLQERAVMRDTTNWVLVRPAGLSDGPLSRDGTPGYLAGPNAAPASYKTIARANVADFILSKCLSGMDEWKRYPVTVYPPQ